MLRTADLRRRAADLAAGPWTVLVDPDAVGWTHTSLRVLDLAPGGAHTFATGPDETLVLPLSGGCVVACEGERFVLDGRPDVFAGPSDFAYVPRDATVTLSSDGGARVALPAARAQRRLPPRR